MEEEKCGRCGSGRIIPGVDILDQGQYGAEPLNAAFADYSGAGLVGRQVTRALRATICADCGHAELYVEEPDALYRAYLAAKQDPRVVAKEQGDQSPRDLPPDACLECGAAIPPEKTACPSCGWTYERV
jgi:hypothetical protein